MGSAASTRDMSASPSPEPSATPVEYEFPREKLKRRLEKPNKTPLVLVACGSFSPPTELHLQMFELAQKHIDETDFEIVGNYMSPCSDSYGKSSLVPAHHRINMCALAIEERNSNAMVDVWETIRRDSQGRPIYTRTAEVLKRLDHQVNDVLGGFETTDGKIARAKIMLLIGADLALTMGDEKVWARKDIDVLLGYYGAFIIERPFQCDIQDAIEPLKKYQHNIWVVGSFENDVSSTKARAQIRNGETALDLPKPVFEYIKLHHLYQNPPPASNDSAPKDAPINQTNGIPNDRALASPIATHR
jgi:nicotinamide mononucleotide adenylyltransferase